jgi:uncharacterized membrane protein YqiK
VNTEIEQLENQVKYFSDRRETPPAALIAKLDAAREKEANIQRLRAEAEQRRAEAQAKRQAEEDRKVAEWHARREAAAKDEARAAWQANGGELKDFEKHWEAIKAEVVKQKTIAHLANPKNEIRVNL